MSPSGGAMTLVDHPITWSPLNSAPLLAEGVAQVVRRVPGVCTA